MINLRYHIVSLAAVLLALAAGVALGSSLLDDTGSALNDSGGTETTSISPTLAGFDAAYASTTSAALLKGALANEKVIVMTTPGARKSEVDGITEDLKTAGATVTGQVSLSSKLLDTSNRQFAESVATQAGGDAIAGSDGYAKVGSALGRAFLSQSGGAADATATTIRSAFSEGGLLQVVTAPSTTAQLALIVTGPASSTSSDEGTVLAGMTPALDTSGGGVLVAGPSSSGEATGAIGKVRASDAAQRVSTFDVTELATGRAAAVLALAKEAQGTTGAWGTSRAADGAMPR